MIFFKHHTQTPWMQDLPFQDGFPSWKKLSRCTSRQKHNYIFLYVWFWLKKKPIKARFLFMHFLKWIKSTFSNFVFCIHILFFSSLMATALIHPSIMNHPTQMFSFLHCSSSSGRGGRLSFSVFCDRRLVFNLYMHNPLEEEHMRVAPCLMFRAALWFNCYSSFLFWLPGFILGGVYGVRCPVCPLM